MVLDTVSCASDGPFPASCGQHFKMRGNPRLDSNRTALGSDCLQSSVILGTIRHTSRHQSGGFKTSDVASTITSKSDPSKKA